MDKVSMARFIVLIVAVINSVLNLVGYQTISDELTNDLVAVVSGAFMIWAAWKDNDITKKAVKRKKLIKGMKKELI